MLGLFPAGGRSALSTEQLDLLEAFASQTAVVVERALLAEEAQQARLRIEAERLRNLLLSSVSHDLRTPLAGDHRGGQQPPRGARRALDEETRRELTQSIFDEAERLNRLLGNLLSMTRHRVGGGPGAARSGSRSRRWWARH